MRPSLGQSELGLEGVDLAPKGQDILFRLWEVDTHPFYFSVGSVVVLTRVKVVLGSFGMWESTREQTEKNVSGRGVVGTSGRRGTEG